MAGGAIVLILVLTATALACGEGPSPPIAGRAPTKASAAPQASVSPPEDSVHPRVLAHVTRVIDGDTFEATVGGRKETIRLIGVDTPETVDPRRTVRCFGKEASDYARLLLTGKSVDLEKDVSERDRFGRLLRYVYLEDGGMVNAALLRDGYARAATYPPDVRYAKQFREIEEYAREGERGLWGPVCSGSAGAATATASGVYFTTCAAADAAGAAPLRRGQPGYRAELDRDGDGVACE